MKLKKFLMPGGIIVGGIVILLGLSATRPAPPQKTVEVKPTIVETLRVESKQVQFKVTTQGTVLPRTESTLVAEVSGVITEVADNYVVGGYFKKGDLIMQIAKIDYEIALKQAQARHDGDNARLAQEKARVKQAEKEWALSGRAKKDAPALALRIPNLREAKANSDASAADLKKAELKLARTSIRAPYDGMVKSKLVDLGQYVNIGTQLAKTFAVDYAEVRLPLSNQDLQFLDLPRPGLIASNPVAVTLSARIGNQEHYWQGYLTRSEGQIDTKSRVYFAVVQINDPYGLSSEEERTPLSMGTFVKAEIDGISMPEVVQIPRSVVKGSDTILVMDKKDQLRVQKVVISRIQNDWIYIQQGLKDGDRVVLTSLETAVAGMTLRDQHYQAPPELLGEEVQLSSAENSNTPVKKTASDNTSPLPQ